ncbi:MAG: hypothetical protein WCP22_03355 [Chlamydiota bacterium]
MTILSELATMIIKMRGPTKEMYEEMPTSMRKVVDGDILRCVRMRVKYWHGRWTDRNETRRRST